MAVALNGFDTLLAPFIKKDNLSYEQIKQNMQNFIYSVNSNSRGGAEPAFFNLTFDLTPPADMLDEPAVIGGKLSDITYGECQHEMDLLNRAFYEVMLEGDANNRLFSYPIPTFNIHSRFDWDNPNNELLWELAGKYGTPYFANFINSDLDISDVRSMCPLSGQTKIIYWSEYHQKYHVSPLKNVYNQLKKQGVDTVKVLSNGHEVSCKINQFLIPADYRITLVNGAQIETTANHLNKVFGKDYIRTDELTIEDYLPVSTNCFTKTENQTYEQGLLVGMFLGDGSYKDGGICYSLNRAKKSSLISFLESYVPANYGGRITYYDCKSEITGKNSCVNVFVNSKALRGLIEQYVTGDSALTKGIDGLAYAASARFRKGILDGLYRTDGGNRNRIYTSSPKLRDDIITLCATLGIATTVGVDTREGRLGTNPCYTVRFYTPNRNQYGDVYRTDDDFIYFRIKSIERVKAGSPVSYCLEVQDDVEPVFMLANGIHTHNCRLRLDLSELRHRNGGLFGAGDSTGSIGVVTINLPRIAYENKGDKTGFYADLARYLEIAKDSLEIKRSWLQENVMDNHLIPAYIEYVGTLNNHFSTIGIVGMNEMCENFIGKNILDEEAHAFCHEVGEFIRTTLLDFQEETGHLYNYEATPAESTSYRFALGDKKRYPDIITQGSGKDCYYTNSCHIPVSLVKGINETFKHQDDLQTQFTGGTVIHCWLEGAIPGQHAKQIVRSMFESYRVPYMSLSPISRYCDTHGYVEDHVDQCPVCGERLKKYQRITGYLRCVDNFNQGKLAEFNDRVQLCPEATCL